MATNASLKTRLEKLESRALPSRHIVRQIIDGVDDPKEVLDRMVAVGEIAEHERGDVSFIIWRVFAPIWDERPDGSARRIGSRNVYTGEVEKVEGWGESIA
jgi:hypothetical protein